MLSVMNIFKGINKRKEKKKDLINSIVSFIKVRAERLDLETFKILLIELRDERYKKIKTALNNIYLIESDRQEAMRRCWNEEHRVDEAVYILLKTLGDNSNGYKDITWELLNEDNEVQEYSFKANKMDSETWKLLKLYEEDSLGNDDGFQLEFIINPITNKLKAPCCNPKGYEICDTFTLKDNMLDSNCDTWGTQLGAKAERIYALYITDIKQYAMVRCSYWCM